MVGYVDGFVAAVPTGNRERYLKQAAKSAAMFQEFGATRVVECWGDDVPDGKVTDFRAAVKAAVGETVVFSWIEFPSRAVRDAAHEKMKGDPRTHAMSVDLAFDGKRMIFGGFAPILDH